MWRIRTSEEPATAKRWNELFAALRSNGDRAIVALAISNGARAPPASTNMPASVVPSSRWIPASGPASWRSSRTSASASPRPAETAGLARSKDYRCFDAAMAKLNSLKRASTDGQPRLVDLGMPVFTDDTPPPYLDGRVVRAGRGSVDGEDGPSPG